MNQNKKHMREWAQRLEQGERDDELLSVAARLEEARFDEASTPPIEFQRQLRRDLLSHYPENARQPRQWWQRVGSLAALSLLAVLVLSAWLSMSSAGRNTFGDAPVDVAPIATATVAPISASIPGYTFLDYSISGGIVMDETEAGGDESQARSLLVPGTTAEITTRWRLPADAGEPLVFALHLLDSEGNILVQSDAPILATGDSDELTGEAVLKVDIPADLPPGEYELSGGLFDTTTGELLAFNSLEGEVMQTMRANFMVVADGNAGLTGIDKIIEGLPVEDTTFGLLEPDRLVVREVSPTSGTVISGTKPIEFAVTVDYMLSSLPSAILEVRVTEVQGEGGRGVGLATVENIAAGSGTTTVAVSVNPAELTAAADLGLLLQLKADPSSAPLFMDLADDYRWRYTP